MQKLVVGPHDQVTMEGKDIGKEPWVIGDEKSGEDSLNCRYMMEHHPKVTVVSIFQ